MKKFTILLLAIFSWSFSHAQYSKKYTMVGGNVEYRDNQSVRSTILVGGKGGGSVTVSTIYESNGVNTDILVTKLDGAGSVLWNYRWGNANLDESPSSIAQTDLGVQDDHNCQTQLPGFIITGYAQDPNNPTNTLALVFKISGLGNATIWNKLYFQPFPSSQAITITRAFGGTEDYIITGKMFDGAAHHLFAMRIDQCGKPTWSRTYDHPNIAGGIIDVPQNVLAVQGTPDKYVIVGHHEDPILNIHNVFLLSVDDLGSIVDRFRWYDIGSDYTINADLTTDGNNNFFLGYTTGTANWTTGMYGSPPPISGIVVTVLDPGFHPVPGNSTRVFYYPSYIENISSRIHFRNSKVELGGYVHDANANLYHPSLLLCDPLNGTILGEKIYWPTMNYRSNSVIADNTPNHFLITCYNNTPTMNTPEMVVIKSNPFILNNPCEIQVPLAWLDMPALFNDEDYTEQPLAFEMDNSFTNDYVHGSIFNCDGTPGLVFSPEITGMDESVADGAVLKLYPNPATHSIALDFGDQATLPAMLKIYDMKGCLVISKIITGEKSNDISMLNSGIYTIQVISKEKTFSGRFAKE